MSDLSVQKPAKLIDFALYRELSKSGIVALVLISVLGGYLTGHSFEKDLNLPHLVATLFGILFLAAGSSALNQVQDRHLDAQMPRTANRPLPSGRISLFHALVFSWGGIVAGTLILYILDPRLAALGALAVISYNFLYTLWWKRKMAYAAVPGAIPGALPILMGYLSASGELFAPGGVYLFGILFFWQMPHFWVLALKYTDDYHKGGIPTLPVAHGPGVTLRQIIIWCLAYVALALGAPLFFPVGSVYLALTVGMSLKLLWELKKFVEAPASKSWLHFFLWINFSLIAYIGGVVIDLWSIYLIRFIKG